MIPVSFLLISAYNFTDLTFFLYFLYSRPIQGTGTRPIALSVIPMLLSAGTDIVANDIRIYFGAVSVGTRTTHGDF